MHIPQLPIKRATPAIWAVLGVCVLAYAALVVLGGGRFTIDSRLVIALGGLYSLDGAAGSPWRLVSAGFLHFSLIHIITNALCLVAWGIPLERRFGSAGVLLLFLGSVFCGNLISLALHSGPFISAGASGGASGLLGALLVLTLMGRTELPMNFFVVNIGLNIVISVLAPNIDWQSHLGGFLGGMGLALFLTPQGKR